MKDHDFDALLDDVLREDGGVEPLAGLEGRVLAGGRAGVWGKGSSRRWMLWTAMAASAISAVLWIGVRPASEVQQMRPPTVLSQSADAGGASAIDEGRVPKSQVAGRLSGMRRRVGWSGSKGPAVLPIEDPIRSAPIEIVPLVIEPIRVSSQRWNEEAREREPNEETSWNVVFVCDSRCIDRRNGSVDEFHF